MAIIAALITASVALLVPFITFYLNKAPTITNGARAVHIDVPVTISPSTRLLVVIPLAFVFCVPIGVLAFCIAVVGNIIFAPSPNIFLFSLDAGLCSSAVFAMSLIFHAGLNEPRQWWNKLKWYQLMMTAFFSALAYVMALIGNTIWAMAHSMDPMDVHIFSDGIDAAILGGIVAWIAAYGTVMIEELRDHQLMKETCPPESPQAQVVGNFPLA